MRRWLPALLVLAVVAVVVVGLVQAGDRAPARGQAKAYDLQAGLKDLEGAPAPLAGLHRQANALLGGGEAAFTKRLRALQGTPVVVNVWASWCGPCRHEFPFFQQVATRLGKRVAFLGVDTQDSRGPGEGFLKEEPLPYPSWLDPKGEPIARSLKLPSQVPYTVLVGRDGTIETTRAGGYASESELTTDIERYLMRTP